MTHFDSMIVMKQLLLFCSLTVNQFKFKIVMSKFCAFDQIYKQQFCFANSLIPSIYKVNPGDSVTPGVFELNSTSKDISENKQIFIQMQ